MLKNSFSTCSVIYSKAALLLSEGSRQTEITTSGTWAIALTLLDLYFNISKNYGLQLGYEETVEI